MSDNRKFVLFVIKLPTNTHTQEKGSIRTPSATEAYRSNFDAIFKKDDKLN